MIQEAYVSYEVAKLLKEKEFNERTPASYNKNGEFQEGFGRWNTTPIYYSASTLQMAIKWLRIVHNLFITIDCVPNEGFYTDIYDLSVIDEYGSYKHISPTIAGGKTPEEVIDATIKYCLENLI